ncbi:MAG: hypothetical protein JWQ04_3269 [Pedosphaera sp.]|nr:hypothetical protein [Pedosphaera sp.]
MKRSLLIACGLLPGLAFADTVINFHDASQGYSHYGGYNVLYYGQGAYSDPGNNVWNGFGKYGAPGSTDFYGAGNADSGHGSVPNGLVGNPYAWHSGTSANGTGSFSPTAPANAANATSSGATTPVTLSLTYGFDNGADGSAVQGSPAWILNHTAGVNNGATGTFTLANIPAGVIATLFLYGANFDNTRGASFTVSSGTAKNGITTTINTATGAGTGPANAFVLGATYVEFDGVTPDVNGNITGTWGAVSNPNSGLTGEGDFNGLQLVLTPIPEPSTMAMFGLGTALLLAFRRRK